MVLLLQTGLLLLVKYFLFILLLVVCLSSYAQQGLQMEFGEVDSVAMLQQRQLEYYQLINNNPGNELQSQNFKLPRYSLLPKQNPPYTFGIDPLSGFSYLGSYYGAMAGVSSYFHNTEILSQAAYQLGNKFVVGGYSYGANNIMAPGATQMQNSYFDSYGSTMFMKYKISKKVSIETSISVGQNRGIGL